MRRAASSLPAARLRKRLLLALAGVTAFLAVAPPRALAAARSPDMNVCAWGYALPKPCVDGQWKEGNPSNDGAFREGDFVPFRAVFRPGGSHPIRPGQTYTLRIGYDIARGGLVAYDYLGTYNASQPDRAIGGNPAPDIVPCSGAGVTTQGPNACGHPPSTTAVPPDPRTTFLSGGNPPTSGEFSAWGVHLDSAAQVVCANQGTIPVIDANTGIPGGPQPRCIDLRFTAEGNGTAPVGAVIAWGGHVATVADWGAGRTYALSGGGGAQFHMRLQASSSFNLGNEEISLRTIGRPAGFTTSVTPRVIHREDTVIDTATLTGRNGAYPRGDVAFFVCRPTTTATSCTSGGRSAGHDEPVVQQGSSIVGTATIKFPSVEAPAPGGLEPGFYCFRAEYTPGLLSPFLPATHTNATTECFRVVTEPLKTLRLEKVCEPPGHFDLHIQSATTFSHTFANVPCNGGDEISVPAGTYTVSESASAGTNPADFDPPVFGSTCLNGSVTITAADTEPVTCTITNFRTAEPRATLTVKKKCQPADDAGVFVVLIGTARYDLRCGEDTGTVELPTGTHTVTEKGGTDTSLSSYDTAFSGACTAKHGSRTASVHLTADQAVTCTITNTRHGPGNAVLTMHKVCKPAHDNGRFVLDINEVVFPGVRCGHGTGSVTLAPGTHLVSEVATPGLTDNYRVRIGGDCAVTGKITLRAGEHATCTVTNIRLHSVGAEEVTRPPARPRPPTPPPPPFTG